jgi:beta-glucosidase/6-phospho-beta-glucosidase/beta-galactosidase
MWTSFNEPWHVCEQAYGQDYMAPAINYPGIPNYLCGHNLLKAHAKVYHMYKNKFQHQNGKTSEKKTIRYVGDIRSYQVQVLNSISPTG